MSLRVTDLVYQGNGAVIAFSDGGAANMAFECVNGVITAIGLSNEQKVALAVYNLHAMDEATKLLDLRFSDGSASAITISPPKITRIDAKAGIVYLDNPSGLQIEVYKYTRKKNGSHTYTNGSKHEHGYEYSPRLGKRYKILYQLGAGVTAWTVPTKWIWPASHHKTTYRSYFKFGVRDSDGTRSDLSSLTVITANVYEYADGIKILLENSGGGGKPFA